MHRLDSTQRSRLRTRFGDRVTFRRRERLRYGCDAVTAPPSARPQIGETVPDAVVQPKTEDELLELACWACAEGVAITPRGSGTSRSGAAVPLRRGIVIDFRRMGRTLAIDPRSRTATVEPGIVWRSLEAELADAGFGLRLYPTSYAGSTAGGWLAHGGAGLGSYEAGWFRDSLVSARIVVPTGEIVELDGPNVDLVYEAEGTTGLVSSLTLRIEPIAGLGFAAAATPDPVSLQRLLEAVVDADLPLWSVSFVDPALAGFDAGAPDEYVVTFAWRRPRGPWLTARLPWIVHDAGAWLLDDDLARREWEWRFRATGIARRFPAHAVAEAVVPLTQLSEVLEEMEYVIGRSMPKEAVLIRGSGEPCVAVHAFVPAEEPVGSRESAFVDALWAVEIAERHGGRPYATGIYFRNRAEAILGSHRVHRMESFRQSVDPYGILNPGKVTGRGAGPARPEPRRGASI